MARTRSLYSRRVGGASGSSTGLTHFCTHIFSVRLAGVGVLWSYKCFFRVSCHFFILDTNMSHVSESDELAFIPPTLTGGLGDGSTPSLRSWTVPRLTAELRHRGIAFPATARKAELFRLLFPSPEQPFPSTSSGQGSILSSLTQIYALLNYILNKYILNNNIYPRLCHRYRIGWR